MLYPLIYFYCHEIDSITRTLQRKLANRKNRGFLQVKYSNIYQISFYPWNILQDIIYCIRLLALLWINYKLVFFWNTEACAKGNIYLWNDMVEMVYRQFTHLTEIFHRKAHFHLEVLLDESVDILLFLLQHQMCHIRKSFTTSGFLLLWVRCITLLVWHPVIR